MLINKRGGQFRPFPRGDVACRNFLQASLRGTKNYPLGPLPLCIKGLDVPQYVTGSVPEGIAYIPIWLFGLEGQILDIRCPEVFFWWRSALVAWVIRLPSGVLGVILTVQEGQFVHIDFGSVAFVALLVFPLARFQAAFDIDLASFADILLRIFRSSAKSYGPVPVGDLFPPIASLLAVFSGNTQRGNSHAALTVPHFGVLP